MLKIPLSKNAVFYFGGVPNSRRYERLMKKLACFREVKR